MNNQQKKYEYLAISPKYLKSDPAYQREIESNRANAIKNDFNEYLFNEPKVSKRDDGFYYIINGNHTFAAHVAKFGEDKPIYCKVFYGLTKEQEMEIFIHQYDHSKRVTNTDKLRAQKNYDDPEVLGWLEATRICKLEIDFDKNPGYRKISSPVYAFQIYKKLGKTGYCNVLNIIERIWDGDEESFHAGMLKGFAYLYQNFGDQFSINEMVAKLSGYPVKKIEERAKILNGSTGKRFAAAIAEIYNLKRQNKNRIQII